MLKRLVLAHLLAISLAACGDDAPATPDAGGPVDYPSGSVPASTVPESGIRRELFTVDGFTPGANPTDGVTTPTSLNVTTVARYRQDVDPPAPAHAILVAMPGFLGGAGNWDPLARNLVRQSIADGAPIEVWAIDRRSNGLFLADKGAALLRRLKRKVAQHEHRVVQNLSARERAQLVALLQRILPERR